MVKRFFWSGPKRFGIPKMKLEFRARLFWKINSLKSLSYFLSPEKLKAQRSWGILQNFNWIMQYTKKTFSKICILANFIIQELKFCKIAQLFLCLLLCRGNLKKLRVYFFFRKFEPRSLLYCVCTCWFIAICKFESTMNL